jgi:hypothetical protein
MPPGSSWIDIAQLLVNGGGLLLVFVGLLVNARQARRGAQATEASTYQNISSLMIDVDRLFVDHPAWKKYFYGHGLILNEDDPDHEAVVSVAEMLVDFGDNVRMQAKMLPDYEWPAWGSYFQDLYQKSPTLRDFLNSRPDWYPRALHQMFEEGAILEGQGLDARRPDGSQKARLDETEPDELPQHGRE